MDAMVEAVVQYAEAHYEVGGWDIVVECYTRDEIAQKIAGCATEAEAIALVGTEIGLYRAVENDVRGWGGLDPL
jgi:hypothetical protein